MEQIRWGRRGCFTGWGKMASSQRSFFYISAQDIIRLLIWMNLPNSTMMMGGVWFLIGAVYLAVTTKGFRKQAKMLDFKNV